jgi:hypothetical protein
MMMSGRFSRAVAVILAATILAVTASSASYGITHKSRRHPLRVTNKGRGPALVLKNRPAYPPLAVGSSKLVSHLNADLVDGVDASDLEPATLRWSFGRSGDALNLFKQLPVPSGWYAVDAHVSVGSNDIQPHPPECFAYPAHQGEAGDYTNVVAEQPRASLQSHVSLSGVLFIPPGDRLEFDCRAEDGATMHLLFPATLTVRPIHVVDGPAAINDSAPMLQSAATHP